MELASTPIERLRRGFTLTEMLVVLAIMAVLTTVAVQSLGPVADQARFEVTQRTLDGARDAILSSNTSALSGFLVDMGRPPASVNELLLQGTLPARTIAPIDATHSIAYGWNGPYLVPPVTTLTAPSATSVVDGWGNALALTNDATGVTIASAGGPSTGAIVATLPATSMYAGSLVVTLASSSTAPLTFGSTDTVSLWYATDSGVVSTSQYITGSTSSFIYGDNGLTTPLSVGPKVVTLTSSAVTATPVSFVLRAGVNTLTMQVTPTASSQQPSSQQSSQPSSQQ